MPSGRSKQLLMTSVRDHSGRNAMKTFRWRASNIIQFLALIFLPASLLAEPVPLKRVVVTE